MPYCPRLTTTAIGAVHLQVARANLTNVPRRKRGRCFRKKRVEEHQESRTESRDFECWNYDRKAWSVG